MNYGKCLNDKPLIKLLAYSLVLLFPLLVFFSTVHAGSNVDIWMNKDTYNLGERATVYFNFPRSGEYTLIQIEPRRETIIRNQRASSGRNRLGGTMERPTGRKRIKVIFTDNYGNRHTATTSYYIQSGSGQSGGGQGEGGSGEGPSLSYFKSNEPSQGGNVARSLQNQVQVIKPGDNNYYQLKNSFNSKAHSLNFSQEQQDTESLSFSFGSSRMEFSVGQGKQNLYSLQRSLNNRGVTFLGNQGGKSVSLMKDPDPGGGTPGGGTPGGGTPGGGRCIILGRYNPTFICLPGWAPWPLPLPWIIWLIWFI